MTPYPKARTILRFNGAATARSRNWEMFSGDNPAVPGASMGPRPRGRGISVVEREHRLMLKGLQWGRDRAVAELTAARSFPAPCWCFNGAATARSRNSLPSRERSATRRGFNGAATARSRNYYVRLLPDGPVEMLQWGRDRAVAELPSTLVPITRLVAASMGPRPRGRGIRRYKSDGRQG